MSNLLPPSFNHYLPIFLLLCLLGGIFGLYKVVKGMREIRADIVKRNKRKAKKQQDGDTIALNTRSLADKIINPEDEVRATTIPTTPTSGPKSKILRDIGSNNEFMVLRKEKKKYKIMIVDDSKTARYTMKEALNPKYFDVIEAVDGLEAYQIIINREPDLVITDIEMPNMDGFELLKRIRKNLKFSQLPVLMVTGNLDIHVEIGDKQGASGFLTKPYEKKDLVDQVEYLLHF